jgi:hypothetical protein
MQNPIVIFQVTAMKFSGLIENMLVILYLQSRECCAMGRWTPQISKECCRSFFVQATRY